MRARKKNFMLLSKYQVQIKQFNFRVVAFEPMSIIYLISLFQEVKELTVFYTDKNVIVVDICISIIQYGNQTYNTI